CRDRQPQGRRSRHLLYRPPVQPRPPADRQEARRGSRRSADRRHSRRSRQARGRKRRHALSPTDAVGRDRRQAAGRVDGAGAPRGYLRHRREGGPQVLLLKSFLDRGDKTPVVIRRAAPDPAALHATRPESRMPSYDRNNVFARILRSELPCRKIYEDEFALAFHDIRPLAPVHVLVVPKGEYVSNADFSASAPAELVAGFWRAVGKVAHQLGLDPPGYRLVANHG